MTTSRAFDPAELLAHEHWLRRLAWQLVRDEARADDLVQETWRRALEQPPRDRKALPAWLARVARNTAHETRRSEGRRRARELRREQPRSTESTLDVVARTEMHRRLVQAVLALEEPYRQTLLLRYFDGLSPRVIAQRLEIKASTVRSRLKRGIDRLRTQLDAGHGGERRAWALALVPLAASRTGAVAGGVVMTLTTKSLTVALLALVLLAASVTLIYVGLDRPGEDPGHADRTVGAGEVVREGPQLIGRASRAEDVEADVARGAAFPEPAPTHRLQLRLLADGALPEGTAHVTVKPIRTMRVGDRWDGSDVEVEATTSTGLLDQDISKLFKPHAFPLIEVEASVDHPSCMPSRVRFKRSEGMRSTEAGPLVYVVEITLRRAGLLRGRVTTENGVALSRAAVAVWPEVLASSGSPVERAFTDETGGYRLRVPDAGDWIVVAGARDRVPSRVVVTAGSGGVVEVEDLVLPPGLAVEGSFAINSAPVPEASLLLSRPPDRDAWQHRHDLRLDALRGWTWQERGGWAHASDLRLWMRAGRIEIRETGTLTKEDGTFRFGGLRAGAYTLQLPAHVSTGFLHPHVAQAERRTTEVPSAPLRIDLETAILRVRVVSEGRAVDDASVTIGLPGPVGPGGARWGPSVLFPCRYEGLTMPVLVRPAFTYRLTARAKGHAVLEREVTSPRAGLEKVVTLEVGPSAEEDESVLPPHGAVRGRLRTSDGSKIAKAAFGFYRGQGSHAVHRRDVETEDGAFQIDDIPAGRWRLVLRAGGTWIGGEGFWQDAGKEIEVVDGETVDVTFDVRRGGRLRLRPRDVHGRPVGVRCRLIDPDGRPFPALYVLRGSGNAGWGSNLGANEGPYEVDRVLPPGRYVVELETFRDRPPRTATGEVLIEVGKVATLEIRVPAAR